MSLLEQAESCRRERPSMSTLPLSRTERAEIARRRQLDQLADPEYMLDYASAGHKISSGMTHLDESLVSGQKQRSEFAFRALQQGMVELQLWMRARGYDV